ncbi:hypothetical protein BH10BAC2_BH10BAC2_17490 [soil metagenome]
MKLLLRRTLVRHSLMRRRTSTTIALMSKANKGEGVSFAFKLYATMKIIY